ncbi:DUF5709 domain-containing protein [Ornithinimicrobium flavum]|uniref:DUF5709 domain-containing protein n=1 Tax=Ornithinimicrobium flavum TaxID=1288636 RepID=UPI001880F15D|nr:DUF5709 domain-containing protein [Ornithinimicrobium flavum]
MSEQTDRETIGDDLGVWSVDAEDQLQPEDTLDGEGDVLDRGFRVGDGYRGVTAFGVTAEEQSHEETIDQRIRQEEPDPWSAYGAPDNESGLEDDGLIGGDDPDAIRPELDYYGGPNHRVGRIIAPDEGRFPDRESRMVAREGRATSWDSPEESAMHFVDGDEGLDDLTEVEWEPTDRSTSEEE